MAFGVGKHHVCALAGLELGLRRAELEELLGGALEIRDREVEVGVLARVRPSGRLVSLYALETQLDRSTVSQIGEVLVAYVTSQVVTFR